MPVVYDLDSPICPIGAPSRENTRHRNLKPSQQAAPKVTPGPTSSRANRRQGVIFNVQDLPQELKDLQGKTASQKPTTTT
ncbi:hypothetical protein PGT21_003095 [Puccinia graminis f. sp. tritici]|uniref:Uncharacterized protein n=2 Tax=Puccinia graminis f. sp. tritici TaxID=56615 RepID=H6QP98_PUCGT|nr:uncharacterized protein PGTG_20697 [Puccinia graminis f. sp. tritici CRL 75-36-700-3]EHS63603.1 hypothetical protein PGTG_20697 [Puccinia graminis f. sp. tritici CRL 75-36-700-3]KAA1077323.1 hypothetical protein PGT21_003095 [Puccinia graminis f. sp. tritici]KAA1137429.1 hypothetical protein PGTUg99_012905 [Puccinia graminis f. sp. tritici]